MKCVLAFDGVEQRKKIIAVNALSQSIKLSSFGHIHMWTLIRRRSDIGQ